MDYGQRPEKGFGGGNEAVLDKSAIPWGRGEEVLMQRVTSGKAKRIGQGKHQNRRVGPHKNWNESGRILGVEGQKGGGKRKTYDTIDRVGSDV